MPGVPPGRLQRDIGCQVTITGSLVARGDAVTLHGVAWGSPLCETVIIQLPSGALVAVPVEDLEPPT